MRQVFLEKGELVIQKVASPQLEDHSVLVSVHYSFISSGTEAATIANAARSTLFNNVPHKIKAVLQALGRHGVEGTKALVKGQLKGTLQALGYSCSGRVIATGKKVTQFRAGDFVACAGAEFAHHADVVCVPENLVVLISNEKYVKSASITTLGAIALQGIRRAQLQIGETVCVLGLGLLGQLTAQLAKAAGCVVIGIDLLEHRLELAKKLGTDHTFLATDENIYKTIEFITHHKGVDCTLITASSKSDSVLQQAMEVTRKKGKVIIVGDVGLKLERAPFYKKEIDLLISCSYGPGRYDPEYELEGKDYPYAYVRWTEKRNMQAIVSFIEKGIINVDALITQEYVIDDVIKAYDQLKSRSALGVVLRYHDKDDFSFVPAKRTLFPRKIVDFIPARKTVLNVGVVGVGGFAKENLLPFVSKIEGTKIHSISDTDVANAENVSRMYGATRTFVQEQDLFDEQDLDVVIIASPHKFHCDQAIQALSRGKAVFMEKPMVTTFEEFKKLASFLKEHPGAPFCVDYNRSFAPFIQKIKWELAERHSPLVMTYRMNAGHIPQSHWAQRQIGAGSIIGEACHIFDLFYFLTGSRPVSVSVEALRPLSDNLFPTDNFSAHISFMDGSICSLVYTSLGHPALGKERMELFFDSKSITMNDYLTLRGYGTSYSFDQTVATQDKGHGKLMAEFFEGIKQSKVVMPISMDRLNSVAELTLTIDKLVCQGGGEEKLTV
ncbi:bi-domain-containing oxidoreductase [Candidatus Babeliales bacterium]|nr:bi-domain-containing oxidoreductase [Candidatus Babeliales bacterium]